MSNIELLFTVGETLCELCFKPAYRRDPDMDYLLCKRCFAQFNIAPESGEWPDEEFDS